MARSEEAIRRRAEKRQRTEEEQREVDRKDMAEAKKKRQRQEQSLPASETNADHDPMREVGAWKCPGCGNENFASRKWCNSKMCNERRPDHIQVAPFIGSRQPYKKNAIRSTNDARDEAGAWTCPSCEYRNFASRDVCKEPSCNEKRPNNTGVENGGLNTSSGSYSPRKSRHDPLTSKPLVWSKQADSETLSKNQKLRKRYQETGGAGMSEADVERAKILIARDERKKQKKLEKDQYDKARSDDGTSSVPSESKAENDDSQRLESPSSKPLTAKSQRDENKKLCKRYMASGGKGMTTDEVERAKALIARKERKRNKRLEAQKKTTITAQ